MPCGTQGLQGEGLWNGGWGDVTMEARVSGPGRQCEVLRLLAGELVSRPTWAWYHIVGFLGERYPKRFYERRRRGAKEYMHSIDQVVAIVCGVSRTEGQRLFEEAAAVCQDYEGRRAYAAIRAGNDASPYLQRLVYCLAVCLRPETVVEVGVARGVTTRTLLVALRRNGRGHLYSVEFPSLRRGYVREVGELVTAELQSRWTLLWGPSQRQLPRVLRTVGVVGLFVHDGAHTYHIQRADYRNAMRHLGADGVLVSDDVNNDSFVESAEAHGLTWMLAEQPGKGDPIGVAFRPRC